MDVQREVLSLIDEVLSLQGRAQGFRPETPLLGALVELDSMAVITLITEMERRFGITIADDDIDGRTFATVGSLTSFIAERRAPSAA